MQMLRPFAAIAQVPREEDHGIDVVATLLKSDRKVLLACDSFVVQVKTHTSPFFEFVGDGIRWLKGLRIPYFPVVANLDEGKVDLFTLNDHHWNIHDTLVDKYVFVPTWSEMESDPGDDFFWLGDPLMSWTMRDCAHGEFPAWAYSVLAPAIAIESANIDYAPISRFVELKGRSYEFSQRGEAGVPETPPAPGEVTVACPQDAQSIQAALEAVIGPFVRLKVERSDTDPTTAIQHLRDIFRALDFDPDPRNEWDSWLASVAEYFAEPDGDES
ncbi:MAG: hypothetical protein CMJ58_11385 [Planctomycetaceae bacterium]|nr:hypothetical protein [Planctomycetaceae bacterium]